MAMRLAKDRRGYFWRTAEGYPSQINKQICEEPVSPWTRDILTNLDDYELARDRGELYNNFQGCRSGRKSIQSPNVVGFSPGSGQFVGHQQHREDNPIIFSSQHTGLSFSGSNRLNPNYSKNPGHGIPSSSFVLLSSSSNPLNPNYPENPIYGHEIPSSSFVQSLRNVPTSMFMPSSSLQTSLPSSRYNPLNPNYPQNPIYGPEIPSSNFVQSLPNVPTSMFMPSSLGAHPGPQYLSSSNTLPPSSSSHEIETLMGEAQIFANIHNPNQKHLTSFVSIMNSGTEILNKLKADAAANIPYRPYQFDVGKVVEQNTELLRFLKETIEPTRSSENILPETSQQQQHSQEPCGEDGEKEQIEQQ